MSDSYWSTMDKCLDEVRDNGDTVDAIIEICHRYYGSSSGDAFFPGGADRDLTGVLTFERSDWSFRWIEADYYWCAVDKNGDTLSHIEGDLQRGNCKSRVRQ